MKFSQYLLNELDDLGRGMMRTKSAVGATGSVGMAAKGMEKAGKGELASSTQRQAIQPYILALEKILANPQLKGRFLQLVKMANAGGMEDQQRAQ